MATKDKDNANVGTHASVQGGADGSAPMEGATPEVQAEEANGEVTLRAVHGREFHLGKDQPVITSEGIKVSPAKADEIMAIARRQGITLRRSN